MGEYKIFKNLVFTKTDREYLTCDVYLPLKKTAIPSVIMIHGGSWKLGNTEAFVEWGIALAERGICAISINYRLSIVGYPAWPGCLNDTEDAVNFLVSRAHEWNLDPQNIGFMGDSSGAHLAFMYTFRHEYTSSRVRFIVGAYGVFDLPAWKEYADRKWPYQPNIVTNLIAKDYETERSFYEDASPYYTVDKALENNPLLNLDIFLTWGDQDGYVPKEQSEAFVEKLKKHEKRMRVTAMPIHDAAHLWFPRDIVAGEINTMDKYPLSVVSPKVFEFIEAVFAKNANRFSYPKLEGGYENSNAFKKSNINASH